MKAYLLIISLLLASVQAFALIGPKTGAVINEPYTTSWDINQTDGPNDWGNTDHSEGTFYGYYDEGTGEWYFLQDVVTVYYPNGGSPSSPIGSINNRFTFSQDGPGGTWRAGYHAAYGVWFYYNLGVLNGVPPSQSTEDNNVEPTWTWEVNWVNQRSPFEDEEGNPLPYNVKVEAYSVPGDELIGTAEKSIGAGYDFRYRAKYNMDFLLYIIVYLYNSEGAITYSELWDYSAVKKTTTGSTNYLQVEPLERFTSDTNVEEQPTETVDDTPTEQEDPDEDIEVVEDENGTRSNIWQTDAETLDANQEQRYIGLKAQLAESRNSFKQELAKSRNKLSSGMDKIRQAIATGDRNDSARQHETRDMWTRDQENADARAAHYDGLQENRDNKAQSTLDSSNGYLKEIAENTAAMAEGLAGNGEGGEGEDPPDFDDGGEGEANQQAMKDAMMGATPVEAAGEYSETAFPNWSVDVGVTVISLVPTDYPVISSIMAFIKGFIAWVLAATYAFYMIKQIQDLAVIASGWSRQSVGNAAAFGTGGQATALVAAALITIILLVAPVAIAAGFDSNVGGWTVWTIFRANPFAGAGSSPILQYAVACFDAMIPVATILTLITSFLIGRTFGVAVTMGIHVAIKWIVP